ncbi:MAG TPA: NAD(P)-dependent oxidoreductase [Xanthobacteraceae bacterium]|nr:NAD(P)-dependent oxidoreductase [Xanthobacteraceae bacterium]
MAGNTKRIFYVRNLASPPVYLDAIAKRPDVRIDKLENDSTDEVATPILAEAHAYQIGSSRQELAPRFYANAALLKRTPHLLIVSTNGAGYDTVDVDDCTAAGVLVINQAGGNKQAVAEHVIGMMLTLTKRIIMVDRAMRRKEKFDRQDFIGNDMFGKTLGIIGIGNVGGRVSELCGGLFQMKVLAYDPYLSKEQVAARGAEKVDDLNDIFRRADFVSVHCPLTAETRGMVGAAQFALMQPHAYFVTAARGFIHDEAALAEALRANKIAGAGLDVWEKEPPPSEHPLLAFDNVLVSPHTAGVTVETRQNMSRIAAAQILDTLDGKKPPRIVNPEVWPVYAERFAKTFGIKPA